MAQATSRSGKGGDLDMYRVPMLGETAPDAAVRAPPDLARERTPINQPDDGP